jgi:hypothetical protein
MNQAAISGDGAYRYFLARDLGAGPTATFIMLNPSTADAEVDDPTVRKCLGFCRRWGCGRLHILNLFAIRSSSPAEMKQAADPVGTETERYFARVVRTSRRRRGVGDQAGLVVCAWGVHGRHLHRDWEVMAWLSKRPAIRPVCLGLTRDGYPVHPLYVPYSVPLVPYDVMMP